MTVTNRPTNRSVKTQNDNGKTSKLSDSQNSHTNWTCDIKKSKGIGADRKLQRDRE